MAGVKWAREGAIPRVNVEVNMPMAFTSNSIVTRILTLPAHVLPANLGKYHDLFLSIGHVIYATIICNTSNLREFKNSIFLSAILLLECNELTLVVRMEAQTQNTPG